MQLKAKEPIHGVANYYECGVSAATAGMRITEVLLDAKDFRHLARLSPEELRDWLVNLQTRFAPGL